MQRTTPLRPLLVIALLSYGGCSEVVSQRADALPPTVDQGPGNPGALDASTTDPPAPDATTNPPAKNLHAPTTDTFLSTLKLMHGSPSGVSPDMYLAPGGMICVVASGITDHCKPFGYATSSAIGALVDQPALSADTALGEPVKDNSLFRLGSTSKMFVGLATAICKNRGLIGSYDDPVGTYIEELANTPVGKTTLKQLFTHTGGLPLLHRPGLRETDPEVISANMTQIINGLKSVSVNAAQVGQFSYSDVGVVLLAEVVARVQSLSYEAFVKDEIMKPLGMTQTYFHTSEIDVSLKTTGYEPNFSSVIDPDLQGYAPVGGMYATGPDMARLMGLFQRALDPGGPRPLAIDPAVIEDLTTIYFEASPNAMGVSIDIEQQGSRTLIGHNGRIDGYASFFSFAKEDAIGLVFLANGGFPLGRTAAPRLLSLLLQ